ncbi:MAG: M23 family metallopeptidase, partial [candidate division Zixibacteria bacterium]|nr:M23 family metallopeptidase [candidate division Zixibacteria bacterium]
MNLRAKIRALPQEAILRGRNIVSGTKNTILRAPGPLRAVLILLLSGISVSQRAIGETPTKAEPSNQISRGDSGVIWPLAGKPDFSSGFGDYRPGRFHYGLDLRTGDKRRPVLATVSGYIWKVSVNYFGFGKALYLKGDNGSLYVMAHLDRFSPEIERVVKRKQLKEQSYFIQKEFKSSEFRVNQGDTICFTGKTGTKDPHLHFEARDSSNTPRSPLTVGFSLNDTRGPLFKSVIFEYIDNASFFSHGSRRQTFAASAAGKDENGARRFLLDKVPYFTAPTGILATVRDYPTNNKFGASPRYLRLRIAEPPIAPDTLWEFKLKYELTLDSLSYLEGDKSLCVYEQGFAQNGSKNCYWLFERDNNCFDLSSSVEQSTDRVGVSFKYGLHRARIEAADAVGNMSVLEFSYFNGPSGPLYELIDVHSDYAIITPRNYDSVKALGISEIVVVEGKSRDHWRESERASIDSLDSGAFRINFDPNVGERKRRLFAVLLKGIDGWRKRDVILSAYPGSREVKVSLSYELKDKGLFVHAMSSSLITTIPQVQLLDSRGSAINLNSRQVGPREFVAFCPPSSLTHPIVGMRSFMFDQSQNAISDEKVCFL